MRHLILGGMFLVSVAASAQSSSNFRFPADSEIRRIISERIEVRKQGVGIVVGIVGPEGRRILAHGHFGTDGFRPVDGNTIFEIGSITKVFTALLLADMLQRAEVKLYDPVAKYLPEEVVVPQRGGKEITLADLATHTSGLPRMPDNFAPSDFENPYVDYSVEQLYQFLSSHQLTRDIGVQWEYSNLGFALLGQALARRAGADYETLVHNRILTPLGMESTAIILSPELKSKLATGHNMALEAVPNWDVPTFAGAGSLHSTATDLLTFLEMVLRTRETPLTSALGATLASRRPTGIGDSETGLGWAIMKKGSDELIWHDGGTGGYATFIGFLAKAKVGVVILSNTSSDVVDIGLHLFDPQVPLASPPKQRTVIAIDPRLYEGYIGRYRLKPDSILTVMREGSHFFAQSGAERYEIFPEGEREFFCKAVDAQITFEVDGKGRAASLVLHLNGQRMRASRIN